MVKKTVWLGSLALMLLATGPLRAQALDEVSVVRAYFSDESELRSVAPLLGHAQVDRRKGMLRTEVDPALRDVLERAGLRVETDWEATLAVREQLAAQRPGTESIPGFACYRTVEETEATMQSLVSQHGTLAEIVDIGDSWQKTQGSGGYDLMVLRATNRAIPGPKPKVFVMSSVHAREYTPAELSTRFVEDLINNYGIDADATWLLDHHEFHALLQANPDGRKRAETGLSWRKNVNNGFCANNNNRGVDLNRNFPFEWGNWNGSSGSACDGTFRGPTPGSEPETQAVVNYVRSQFDDRRGEPFNAAADVDTQGLFFDVHSFSGLVLWPWGFQSPDAPNGLALAALGRRMAGFNGYTPQQAIGLYATDGTTDDFAYGDLGVAAYTFELGTAFFQDCASFENTIYPDNRRALRYALRAARAPYLQPFGPDIYGISVTPDLAVVGEPVQLSATVDDARQREGVFVESGPQPPVQAIAAAFTYVDGEPWTGLATPIAMSAGDGSFNTSIEQVTASISTGSLGAGRHLAYIQGQDADGNDGPPAAVFIDIRSPSDVVTVQGSVTAIGSFEPLAATVTSGSYSSATNPTTGDYQRRLPAGPLSLAFRADGFESLQVDGLVGVGGSVIERNAQLYRLCGLIDDPVDLGGTPPWTASSPWTRRGGAGQDGGAVWLQSASGNYGSNINASLTGATISLVGYENANLSFDQRCDTESGYDYGRVEISSNGGSSWTEVYRCDGDNQWRRISLELPQLDGVNSARIRFRFSSDGSVTASGWALDNIKLQAGGQVCRDSQGGPRPEPFRDGFEADPN